MKWATALIFWIFGPLVLLGAWCLLRDIWRHRNPVIRARPQPDARANVYRIDRADRKAVRKWLA